MKTKSWAFLPTNFFALCSQTVDGEKNIELVNLNFIRIQLHWLLFILPNYLTSLFGTKFL